MKKVVNFPALYLFLVFTACARSVPVDIRTSVDVQLRANAQRHGIPAQAVLVLHNSDVLYRNATGTTAIEGVTPVTPKTNERPNKALQPTSTSALAPGMAAAELERRAIDKEKRG